MELHLPTLIVTAVSLNLLVGVLMLIIFQSRRSQKSFLTWAIACFVFALGAIVASLRTSIDQQWLTIFVADLLIVLTPLLAIHGLRQYQVQGPVSLKLLTLVISYTALPLTLLYTAPNHAQVFTSVVCAAIFLFAAAYMLSIKNAPSLTKGILFFLFLVHALLMFGLAGTLFQNLSEANPMAVEPLLNLILITHLFLTTGTTMLFPVFAFAMTEKQLLELANFDDLTQLYNRRAFYERSSLLLAKNRVLRRPFVVLMIDVDHFKTINDRYGHTAGDACLQQLAYLLRYATRDQDIVARVGGEEFAIAIPDIDRNQAELLSYRLCEQVSQEIFEVNGERVPLTVSIGIIYSQSSRRELEELIEAADGALYEAKAQGRNGFAFA
ncbi:GGDEF domain-containing protein [Pseudidiomarina sediminum]|uniref:diguanylate cyclase n=1 Tax=Pseudidiomarina sediminum TaxID=431675 RepID=A0A432ZAB5_9GAMM|nr:GGDEF domain-containing protein [Pseudidiomarina sediminum]RUO74894.1 GGDEF domain-containing protein [Pseudidiomarina sediminum]